MSGADPCVHTRGSSDRQVVIASPVEPRRVSGNAVVESLWPCVSTNWCVEHDDVTTWWRSPSPCETHRCVKNVAGESPWLRGDIYRCAGHNLGGTSPVMTTTQ